MSSKIPLLLAILAMGAFQELALQGVRVAAWPASSPHANHIVSFVHQKRLKAKQDDITNFDFENIRNDVNGSQTSFDRLADELDMTLKKNDLFSQQLKQSGVGKAERNQRLQQTDDSADSKQNTLDDTNELFGNNNQHESPGMIRTPSTDNNSTDIMWQRNKQSIPVLETVRHFVQSVRDGTLNPTIPNRNQNHNHHHQLIGGDHVTTVDGGDGGVDSEHKPSNKTEENPAIETEEERTHTEESTEFKLLEVLGSFGGVLWNFLMSIQKFFAASSGGASAASSSQASASSSGGGAR